MNLMAENMKQQENQTNFGGVILLLGVAAIWGTSIIVGKIGVSYLGPFAFTLVRNILAGTALLFIVLIRDHVLRRPAADSPEGETVQEDRDVLIKGGLACGFFLFAGTYLQHAGLQYIDAGKGGFLMALYMVIVPVVSIFFLKQKPPRSMIICIPLAVSALWLLSVHDGLSAGKGEVLSFLSAFGFAGHILSGDYFAKRCDVIKMSVIQFYSGAVMAAVGMVIAGETQTLRYLPDALLPMLYCGFIAGAGGFTLQLIGQRYVAASLVGLLISMESVFSVLMGFIFLHERLSVREALGCVMMFAAILISQSSYGKEEE